MRSRLHSILRDIGRVIGGVIGWIGLAFLLLLAVRFVLPESRLLTLAVYVTGIWLASRLLRAAIRRGIWRLRNRLLAAYLFMAVVPILLIGTLAVLAARAVVSQLAVYLVTSELDRRIEGLRQLGDSLAKSAAADRRIDPVYRNRYPGIAVLLREPGRETRYPPGAQLPAPAAGWGNVQGVVRRADQYFLWSHQQTPAGDVTCTTPLTAEFLSALAPPIGQIGFGTLPGVPGQRLSRPPQGSVPASPLPAPFDFFDPEVRWFAAVPALDWDHPAGSSTPLIVAVRSRAKATAAAMYDPS